MGALRVDVQVAPVPELCWISMHLSSYSPAGLKMDKFDCPSILCVYKIVNIKYFFSLSFFEMLSISINYTSVCRKKK